jgi:4-hydroxy-tetrahydrodipicolinate synthase
VELSAGVVIGVLDGGFPDVLARCPDARSGPLEETDMAAVFTGIGVALLTLFRENGDLDADATGDLAARLVDLGVRGVVVCGTTGEAMTLEADERVELVTAVRAAVPAHVPVLAGTGAASGRQAAVLTARAFDAGADAVLVLSPPGVADPRPYYDGVAKAAADRPVLAYHFPLASAPGIPVELLPELPVVGVKDSTADPERLLLELDTFEGDVYVGSPTMLTMAGAVGAAGAVLALANLDPEVCARAFAGDGTAQRALLRTHVAAAREFPAGLKAMVAKRFGVGRGVRQGH